MNTRIGTIVTAATLVLVTTGCGATKNFLFGRGARCGLCSSLGSCLPCPQFGNMMPRPCASSPIAAPAYAPAPLCQSPACQTPAYQAPTQGVVTAPSCGCQDYAGQAYDSEVYSSGTCGCGNAHNEYGPVVSDPYLSSGQVYGGGSATYGEQIIGESTYPQGAAMESYPSQPVPTQSYPGQAYPSAPTTGGDWQARKFDTDGNKILWEEPLPSGATSL